MGLRLRVGNAEAAGMKRFADHREVLPDYPGGVYAVNRKWAGDNRALVVGFLRVWNDALRWAQDQKNRDEAIKVLAEAERIDEQAAANRLRQSPKSGGLNPRLVSTVSTASTSCGV